MLYAPQYKDLNPGAESLDADNLRRKIKNLSAKLETKPKPRLEARIIDLRMKLAETLKSSGSDKTPEDRFKSDLFVGETGIPEVDAKDLTSETIASGLLFHGALMIRGLYNAEQIAFLTQIAEQEHAHKVANPKNIVSTFSFCHLMRVYEESGLLNAVKGYLGDDAIIAIERARLRYKGLNQTAGLSWHQDGSYFGEKCFALNCWAAVTECGRKNNGLSLVPRRNHEQLGADAVKQAQNRFGKADLAYGNKVLKDYLPKNDGIKTPFFNAGDAIIFDEMTLHRTGKVKQITMPQIVSISWFFSLSRFPKFKTPLGF